MDEEDDGFMIEGAEDSTAKPTKEQPKKAAKAKPASKLIQPKAGLSPRSHGRGMMKEGNSKINEGKALLEQANALIKDGKFKKTRGHQMINSTEGTYNKFYFFF
jgi:hypothetical protein